MKGERIKAYIDKLIAEKGIPYIDFYMSVGGEDVFRYYASKDGNATGKEMLWLFSATKPITVVAAMRLIEEGKLSLDDEVAKYIPAFENTVLQEGMPTKNKITVRQLFTMSAGLSYHTDGEPYKTLIQQAGEEATTLGIVNALAKAPLLFEPGDRFQYSLCHDVLAAVVEVASGKRFSEYMDEVVFQPLGMLNTGFHTEKKVQLAPCYFVEKGEFSRLPDKNYLVFTDHYDSGGAGAISCVDDYAKFAKTLALGGTSEKGYRLIGAEALKQLRTCQYGNLQLQSTFTCVQGEDYGYGLGVRVRKTATDWGLPEGEFGWDGAAGTYLMVDPVNQISIVIGMHVRNWPEIFIDEHLQLVQRAYEDLQEKNPEKR